MSIRVLKSVAIVLFLFAFVGFAGCVLEYMRSERARKAPLSIVNAGTYVPGALRPVKELPRTRDNYIDTAEIRAGNDHEERYGSSFDDVIILKYRWEVFFPEKRVVSFQMLPGQQHGRVYGMAIHYEVRPPVATAKPVAVARPEAEPRKP